MPAGPSAEEIQQKERKDLIQYAEGVAEEAKSYQNEIIEKQIDKKEAKELSRMGYEEKFVPEYAKGDFAPLGRHWEIGGFETTNTNEWVAQPK